MVAPQESDRRGLRRIICCWWHRCRPHRVVTVCRRSAAQATDVPSPDVIYSIIREPHHQSPFLSWAYFRDHWLPGYVMVGPMLLDLRSGSPGGARRGDCVSSRYGWPACWRTWSLVWAEISRSDTGVLGKFYLFRPSSLILAALADAGARGRAVQARAACVDAAKRPLAIDRACVPVSSGWPVVRVRFVAEGGVGARERASSPAGDAATAPGDVVLIDPDVEVQLLDFERRTGRPSLVMWKFARPTMPSSFRMVSSHETPPGICSIRAASGPRETKTRREKNRFPADHAGATRPD